MTKTELKYLEICSENGLEFLELGCELLSVKLNRSVLSLSIEFSRHCMEKI